MKYGLDDRPGVSALVLYGAQWWVVSLPSILIMGLVVSRLHFAELSEQVWYMQKLFAVMGAATALQVLIGHGLPLVVGPASTLLVGIVASTSVDISTVYTSILVGGALMTLIAFSGVLSNLRFFFTPRIVAVILVLIAFTLAPTILRLLFGTGHHPPFHLAFALVMIFGLVICNLLLPGIFRSLTVLIGITLGTLGYAVFMGMPEAHRASMQTTYQLTLLSGISFDLGTILSFLFCFLALLINELGSIESVGQMLKAEGMSERIRRGVGLQGVANMTAGGLGIIGPVDYSMSAGMINATGCASRFTLVPAGIALFACAFFPSLVSFLARIPGPVMGALMLYLMASQLASGLSMLVEEKGVTTFESGLCVGLPLMIGLLISFAPAATFDGFPDMARPIVGNGFVMGTVSVIVLEHLLFKRTLQRHEQV